MSKNKIGQHSPIPKLIYLKIRRRDGVESLTILYGRPSGSKGFQNLIKTSKTGKDFKERKKDLKQEEKDLKSRKRFQKQRKTSNTDKDFKNW